MKAIDRVLDGLAGFSFLLFIGSAFVKEITEEFIRHGPIRFFRGSVREFEGFLTERRVMRTDREWDWSGVPLSKIR